KLIREKTDTRKCHNYGFWVGYHDDADPKKYRHKNKPHLFTWLHDQCETFEVWEKNQPNDNISESEEGQNCVQLWYRPTKNGNFDDEYCYEKKGYVCQFPEECSCA
ncbi:C-type lectin domain family 19 member A-like, partial [Saccoglossus kowalevskii]